MFRLNINDIRNFTQYKSVQIMRLEQSVQKERYRMRVHPHSRFRIFWETFYCGFVLINIGCSLLYHSTTSYNRVCTSTAITLALSDLCIVINIYLNFITGFFKGKRSQAIMSLLAISKKYLSSFFIADFLGLILGSPLWCFAETKVESGIISTFSNLLLFVRYLGLFLRCITACYYWKTRVSKYYRFDDLVSSSITCILAILVIFLFLTSITYAVHNDLNYYFTTDHSISNSTNTFITIAINIWRRGTFLTDLRKPYLIFLNAIVVSIPYFRDVFIATILIFTLWSRRGSSERYNELFHNLNEYLERVKISKRLKLRITKCYEELWDGKFYDETHLLDCVSSEIKEDIISLKIARFREEITILRLLPIDELILLSRHLVYEVYFGNDVVAYSGRFHDRMYFIARGTVAVYTDSARELFHISNSRHFLYAGVSRTYTPIPVNYMACETTVLYSLSRKDYLSIIDFCPTFNQLASFFGDIISETGEFFKAHDNADKRDQ